MKLGAWAAVIGAAWVGGHGCGAQMGKAPQAVAAGADMAPPVPQQPPGAVPTALAERTPLPGGDALVDAAELNGRTSGAWAVVREFPVATYDPADDGPRRDFRETIFWSPEVHTGADGRATVQFPTSDAITAFRITAEGIAGALPGHAETTITSRVPLALAANLPVEVTAGDRIALPVTITNSGSRGTDAAVTTTTGAALVIANAGARTIHVPPHAARTVTYQIDVTGVDGAAGAGDIEIAVTGGAEHDSLRRSLRIVPNGFPSGQSFAGTLAEPVKHTVTVPAGVVTGSIHSTIKLYPSPVATMATAVDSIVREPSGCFEQASSANYPNVMVLSYLGATGASSPEIAAQATAALDSGYQLLTGYESKTHGFEWFGGDPGHEALSAYGLLEFREMAKVYPDLDPKLVTRTAAWLRSRRDGKGGYLRNPEAIDSFGAAGPDVTNAYITYALAEAGEKDLATELDHARAVGKESKDPYILALSAAAVLAASPTDADGKAALARLARLQAKDGGFPGAADSITRSGGAALEIETSSLAALAMMKSSAAYHDEIQRAVGWITKQRGEWGGFSSTQATILALKALTAQAATNRVPAGAKVTLSINGAVISTTALEDSEGAIDLPDLGPHLIAGDNVIELRTSAGAKLDYSLGVHWYDRAPVSSAGTPVAVTASLDRRRVRVGRPVRLTAVVANLTDKGQPMTMARLGVPGGLHYQPWQLDELVAKHAVDFIETREREVILYFRQMKPGEKRKVPIELLAQVPGHYVGPPSSAYLYYTDEHRRYDQPLGVDIQRPAVKKKKPVTAIPTTGPAPTK